MINVGIDNVKNISLKKPTGMDTVMYLAIVGSMSFLMVRVFTGFDHVDEADIVFDIYRLLQNFVEDRDPRTFIWIDTGINGPLHYYLYALIAAPLSYLIGIPMDVAMRLTALATIPFSVLVLRQAATNLLGEDAGDFTVLVLLITRSFLILNTTAIGEAWYTLLYAISLYFISAGATRKNVYWSFCFFALGLLSKYTFAPLLLIHLCILSSRWKAIGVRWYDLILGTVVLCTGFAPLVLSTLLSGPEFLNRFSNIQIDELGLLQKAARSLEFLVRSSGLFPSLMFVASIPLFIVKAIRSALTPAAIAILLGCIASLAAYIVIGTQMARYIYPLILTTSMIVGFGFQCLIDTVSTGRKPVVERITRHACIVLCVILAISVHVRVVFPNGRVSESHHRAAARYVLDRTDEDDTIVAINSPSFYIFSLRPLAMNPLFNTFTTDDSGQSQFLLSNERCASVRFFR